MATHSNHNDHDDEQPEHQAPWVTVLTIAICFGITGMMVLLKSI